MDRTILVVEDDFANQQVALLFLKKLGYSSEIAANGKVAVDLTLKKKYLLILMDCQMPVLSGFEASIAIRNSDGPNQQTPIIALTANMVENVVEQCKKSGIDDILNKPINMDNMAKILAKWIGQSSICTVAS